MTSTDLAIRGTARGALALTPDQTDWTPQQIAALRQLGIEDAPEGDLLVFRHVCQSTGLDPFRKQIYMIGRKTKVKYWNDQQKRQVEDWVMKYTIQTGIDGFRKNGNAAAKREGDTVKEDGPYWQGADGGGWTDVWLSDKPPAAAKYVIFRNGEPKTGIAMYREFVQTAPGSDAPNSMWKKMPANQLAKCAEAQAWRRAYPDDFSGMQLEDAAQIIDPDGAPSQPTRARSERVSAAELMSGASNSGAKPDNEQVDESPKASPESPVEYASAAELARALSAELERHGHKTAAAKRRWLSSDTGREIGSAKELTAAEAIDVIDRLKYREAGDMPILRAQWTQAAAMLDQLGADTDEKKVFFLRNFLQRNEIRTPFELNERQAAEVLTELTQLVAEEAQASDDQLPMDGAEGGEA